MSDIKLCDVCGAVGASRVTIAIDTVNLQDIPVGTSRAQDVCTACRSAVIDAMFATIKTDIEAAIIAV